MFNIIRIALCFILSFCALFIIGRSRIVRKGLASILSVGLCLIVVSLSATFPVENIFIAFNSPESAFNYYAASGEIEEIIDGQDSCLVIYSIDNSTYGQYIFPKTAKGYKIPGYFDVGRVSHKFDMDGVFEVSNVKGTEDYYVSAAVGLSDGDNEIEILNENGEKVACDIVRPGDTDFIYLYLHGLSDAHYLSVNGERTLISG